MSMHVVLPPRAAWLTSKGGDPSGWPIPAWTLEGAIAMMDEPGIAIGQWLRGIRHVDRCTRGH
jgi:hypothetical protein